MAKSGKKRKQEEELEELEDLEDLEEDEEEDEEEEDDSEDEDEDDDEEDAPASKKKSKARKESDTVGSAALADALETSGRELRVMLRQREVEKNENGRYEWPTVDAALKDMGFKSIKGAQKALSESRQQRLEELKERVGATKEGKATKKGKKKKSSKS